MRIQFIAHANCRGQAFRPGDLTEMDEASAAAYIRVGQAVPAPAAAAAETVAGKHVLDRPGAPVETAAAPARERRRKK